MTYVAYPAAKVGDARRLLAAEPGLSWRQMGHRLGVGGETVKRWVDPDYTAHVNARVKRNWQGRKRVGRLPVAALDRMVELRQANLSHATIAAVVNLDHGTRLKADGVRRYLRLYSDVDTTSPASCRTANDMSANFERRAA